MSKIPFVLQPKNEPVKEVVGNEEIGAVEILRRGYLTVGEKALVQGAGVNNSAFRGIQVLAAKIAKQQDITVAAVMEAMANGTILDVAGPEMGDELGERRSRRCRLPSIAVRWSALCLSSCIA